MLGLERAGSGALPGRPDRDGVAARPGRDDVWPDELGRVLLMAVEWFSSV